MKITVILAALTLSAGALAQDTRPPSSTTPSDTLSPPASTTTPTSPSTTSPSGATTGAPAQWPTFESLDTNADGRLTSNEAQVAPSLASKFPTLDKQGRGYITREEYQSYSKSDKR